MDRVAGFRRRGETLYLDVDTVNPFAYEPLLSFGGMFRLFLLALFGPGGFEVEEGFGFGNLGWWFR